MPHRRLDALRAIDDAVATERPARPIQLTEGYLRMVRAIEALPENQDGADKSQLWSQYEYCRRHFAAAVRQ